MGTKRYLWLNLGLAVFVLGVSVPVYAGPYDWLKESPAGHFTDEDWKLLRNAARHVLDNGKDGTMERWKNRSTGHFGSIQPMNTFHREGMRCRKATFSNDAGSLAST